MMQVDPYILRRAGFLLAEAVQPDATKDQTITIALRVISNYVTVGKDLGSRDVKLRNPRMSVTAFERLHELMKNMSGAEAFKQWHVETTNEHPEPIRGIWEWIMENAKKLTVQDVVDRMLENAMVTITNAENSRLRAHGLVSRGVSSERYQLAGIIIAANSKAPREIIAVNRSQLRYDM